MRSLPEQIRDAWKSSGIELVELIQRSGLDTSPSSLSRKLRGEQVMTTDEAQALARALGVNLVWVPDEAA